MTVVGKDISQIDNIRFSDLEYIEKDYKAIISDIGFDSEDKELLCEDIILHLETTAAEEILKGNCVQIPFVGCLRKSPLKKHFDENINKIRTMSKHLSKENFKEFAASIIQDKKDELRKQDYLKAKIKEIKNKNKKKYETYYKLLGPAYANMFISSIMMMRIVEFDEEFEEVYQNLRK